jgi:hypothetical protein
LKEIMPLDDSALWWAGKELLRNKLFSDYIGKNEKTKIVAKIQRVSDQPMVLKD